MMETKGKLLINIRKRNFNVLGYMKRKTLLKNMILTETIEAKNDKEKKNKQRKTFLVCTGHDMCAYANVPSFKYK